MPSTLCKSICRIENGFITFSGKNGYKAGFKYCKTCDKGTKTDSYICKCCGGRLRSSPRGRTK